MLLMSYFNVKLNVMLSCHTLLNLLVISKKHLSHQLQKFLQTQVVFHELLIVNWQYMSPLEENLIGKM